MGENIEKIAFEHNVKIYKKYKMFAFDWVFFYSISVLYYSITKGFSMSQIVYITAFYTLFYSILQIPGNKITKRLGLKKTMIIGNILSAFTILVYIFAKKFEVFLFMQFFNGFAFVLKGLTESSLVYSSLKKLEKHDKFDKIEGNANAKYYFLDALSCLAAGLLFSINNYIPVIISFIITIISLVISFEFYDIKQEDQNEDKIGIKRTILDFFEIMSVNRLKSIFLVGFVFSGIIYVTATLYKSILIDMGLETEYITIVVFFFTLFSGFGSKFQHVMQKLLKNKTITVYSYVFLISLGGIGIVGLTNTLSIVTLTYMIIFLCIMGFIQGAYKVAMRRYIVSFTTSKVRNKISSVYFMFEYLGNTITSFVFGLILEVSFITNSIATIILSIVGLIAMFLVISYMDGKIGLKPEEYSSKEKNNICKS